MDSKSYAIGILSLTATVIATALLVSPTNAGPVGTVVNSDRDFSIATARVQNGGDALYIMDKRRGLMAVLTYDPNTQALRVRASEPVANAFGGATTPVRPNGR